MCCLVVYLSACEMFLFVAVSVLVLGGVGVSLSVRGGVIDPNRVALGLALRLVYFCLGFIWVISLVWVVALFGMVSHSTCLVRRWWRGGVRVDMVRGEVLSVRLACNVTANFSSVDLGR